MKSKKGRNKRQSVNAVSLLVTCMFLFLAVKFSDGGVSFATNIIKITENLDIAVLGLDGDVTYTDYLDNSTYYSSAEFSAGGMSGLYNLTNMFIDAFAPADILMDGILSVDSNNNINVDTPEASAVLKYYARLVAILLFLVLCMLMFPLCGLFFCCCRCCGNCGAKPQPSDKKKDTCKKVVHATLLIMCGTALLFCIVCAFGSNQQLQEGIESFPANMNNSINDTKTFMDSTNGQINHLLVDNYNQFTDAFMGFMNNSTKIAMEQLMFYSNATAVSDISTFANNLTHINTTLVALKTDTNQLRVYASQLNDALRKVKRDLRSSLEQCAKISTMQSCKDLKDRIERLQTSIDFNAVPDVSETIDSFNKINIYEIQTAAQHATAKLDEISQNINKTLNDGLTKAKEQIKNSAKTIQTNLDSVTDTITQIKNQIDGVANPAVNTARDYINEYGKYRYYVGLSISCVLLLVAVCIMLGLICGICGKRPDGYSDNCCNKGAGGQFLICAVGIMFLFGFIISIITFLTLLVGVISEKAVCDPFRNPNPNEYTIIKLLDGLNLNLGVDVTPSKLLQDCYQNKSIYETFNLKNKFNIAEITSKFNITKELETLNISAIVPENFTLLDSKNLEKLNQLKMFNPNINVNKFVDELQVNFTNYNLSQLSTALNGIILELSLRPDSDDLIRQLQLSLLHLNTYEEKLVIPMNKLADELVESATGLSTELNMGKSNFTVAISDLIDEIKQANLALSTNGTAALTNTTEAFKEVLTDLIDRYINRVTNHTQYEIGQCGPLNLVIHASITSTCDKVLIPWNGFWFSLFWTIILYILTIIITVKLANLYRKHKPYDQYVEAEYLYDAYADRGDNIPLNSRGGAKRGKKKGKKSKRYEERPNTRDVAREFPAGSRPPDGRYSDMAPKHWEEFPNGGPPHYQRAPTEYERPPPYYYPGSGGEQ